MLLRSVVRFSVLIISSLLVLPLAPAAAQDSGDHGGLPTYRSQVNVVNLFFNVKDKKGGLIPNLTRNDFQVFEDGKAQTIKYFSSDTNQPLTLGILIDTSPSQERVLQMEKEVGTEFLHDVLRSKDLAFVLSFDLNIELLQDLTDSSRLLKEALYSTKINGGGPSGGLPGMGGGPIPTTRACCTYLYDAVYLASHDVLAKEVGRKAMIILTDGDDEGSKLKMKDAIEAAQKADSICYVILIADRGFYPGGYHGDSEMKKLTAETGGRVIEAGNKQEKLKEAFDQIAAELRTQYSVGYTPSNAKLDGSFRRVEIRTHEGYKVQARSGYYAIKSQTGD